MQLAEHITVVTATSTHPVDGIVKVVRGPDRDVLVYIRTPLPWVLRKRVLCPEDVS